MSETGVVMRGEHLYGKFCRISSDTYVISILWLSLVSDGGALCYLWSFVDSSWCGLAS